MRGYLQLLHVVGVLVTAVGNRVATTLAAVLVGVELVLEDLAGVLLSLFGGVGVVDVGLVACEIVVSDCSEVFWTKSECSPPTMFPALDMMNELSKSG